MEESQLKISKGEAIDLGFERKSTIPDEMNPSREYYEIETVNGSFQYNITEKIYVWYHKTVIGKVVNWVSLDINNKAELMSLLKCFKVAC